jgi:hypothetical protein
MAIEIVPLPLPASADASMFGQMGREVKGYNPETASEEELKEIQDLLYKVRFLVHVMSTVIDRRVMAARHPALPRLPHYA